MGWIKELPAPLSYPIVLNVDKDSAGPLDVSVEEWWGGKQSLGGFILHPCHRTSDKFVDPKFQIHDWGSGIIAANQWLWKLQYKHKLHAGVMTGSVSGGWRVMGWEGSALVDP